MRKHTGICVLMLVFLAAGVLWSSAAFASDDHLYNGSPEVDSMMTKLGRGFANFFTGWVEIPKQIGKAVRETDPASGMFVGMARGMAWGLARTAAGAYEVVTFPFPVPKGYKPLIEPEYIVKSVWGEPIPILCDPNNNAWDGTEVTGIPAQRG
jgi:putative exosortase-associated protein (TIGR04073 family)